MPVQNIQNDGEFGPMIQKANGKLVVIDFYADWCKPCKNIAPYFEELSNIYTESIFLKVDTQTCDKIAESFRVSGIPYFVLMRNGSIIDTLTGAKKEELKLKIEMALSSNKKESTPSDFYGIKGANLNERIDKNKSGCLNEDANHPWTNAVIDYDNQTELKSDCDEEILLRVVFDAPIKLYGVKIAGSLNSPTFLKIFTNKEMPLDFDAAVSGKSTYDCKIEKSHLADEAPALVFPKIKFLSVRNITIFAQDNFANSDVTSIKKLIFIGQDGGKVTDMSEFKRVSGKAGERD